MLGDSWMNRSNAHPHICFSQSPKQRDYIELKRRLLATHFQMGRLTQFGDHCRVLMSGKEREFSQFVLSQFYANGERGWPVDSSILSTVSILFWYLDDGYLLLPFRLGGRGTNFTIGFALKALPDEVILGSVIPTLKRLTGVTFGPRRTRDKIKAVEVNNRAGVKQFLKSLQTFWHWVPPSMWYKVGAPIWED
jgi:hypothetical protein